MKKENRELLLRYLKARSQATEMTGACSNCGHNHWEIAGLFHVSRFGEEMTREPPNIGKAEVMPLVVLFCKNCMVTQMFAWVPIVEWGKENPLSPNN